MSLRVTALIITFAGTLFPAVASLKPEYAAGKETSVPVVTATTLLLDRGIRELGARISPR
jgi:hypothetical protein